MTTYYGFSAVKMAAGNRLIDYADVIVSTLVRSIPIILLLFLPAILIIAFGGAYWALDDLISVFPG